MLALVVLAVTPPAIAQRPAAGPTLHEPIPPDPREDAALSLTLEGDLPAAIETPRGLVSAPDPARPVGTGDAPYSAAPKADAPGSTFRPDRDTRRPDMLPYDDPFSPSTAPFKRLSAYDTVDASYTLSVRDAHTTPVAVSATPPPTSADEHFFADMVVDLAAGRKVRIPTVGPATRVLHARAAVGTQEVKLTLYKDGAENWFIEGDATVRARVVMELAAPRAGFGGDIGSPTRAELRAVPPLPPNVRTSAALVAQRIGVTPRTAPRLVVTKLVAWFRAFQDSDDPPTGRGDIYLDLALQQKGVCRHRAFAFLVTALYLGIPTRMVTNEAHAWVEVDDGHMWRRIDLGGAGRTLHDPLSTNVPHEPPPDPFGWPQGASRGDDLADRARRAAGNDVSSGAAPTGSSAAGATASRPSAGSPAGLASGERVGPAEPADAQNDGSHGAPSPVGSRSASVPGPDVRPPSTVTLALAGNGAPRRGAPFAVRGEVSAEGEPCAHVAVEISLRGKTSGVIPVGALATDPKGVFEGALVLPPTMLLGDYEAHAQTLGDSRCGRGQTK